MQDVIQQLRTAKRPRPNPLDSLRTRILLGLPGSVVLVFVVLLLMPLSASWPYWLAYGVVQFITLVRVLIAVQMRLTIRHINPTRGVAEVAEYVERMGLLQRFNRRYTLWVKLPLTVCVVPIVAFQLGWDVFADQRLVTCWLGVSALLIAINAVVSVTAFRRLEKQLASVRENMTV